jgi:hypothetical protein
MRSIIKKEKFYFSKAIVNTIINFINEERIKEENIKQIENELKEECKKIIDLKPKDKLK